MTAKHKSWNKKHSSRSISLIKKLKHLESVNQCEKWSRSEPMDLRIYQSSRIRFHYKRPEILLPANTLQIDTSSVCVCVWLKSSSGQPHYCKTRLNKPKITMDQCDYQINQCSACFRVTVAQCSFTHEQFIQIIHQPLLWRNVFLNPLTHFLRSV